jgi:hypothetical protein
MISTGRTTEPQPTTPPAWDDYWTTVGNEDFLYARELIELSSSVRAHFAGFLAWRDEPVMVEVPGRPSYDPGEPSPDGAVWRDIDLDWKAAAAAADAWGASSTERRLLDLVLSLVQPDTDSYWEDGRWVTTGTRLVDARDLGSMGSWRDDVAEILARYITGKAPLR